MKLELQIDEGGSPIIKITHREQSESLEEKLLGIFIERAQKNGVKITYAGGCAVCGTEDVQECYAIKLMEQKMTFNEKRSKAVEFANENNLTELIFEHNQVYYLLAWSNQKWGEPRKVFVFAENES